MDIGIKIFLKLIKLIFKGIKAICAPRSNQSEGETLSTPDGINEWPIDEEDYEDEVDYEAGYEADAYSETAEPYFDSQYSEIYGTKSTGRLVGQFSADMEDRKHDWLAKQIREEKIKGIYGPDGLDLGAGHRNHCDAYEIKESHHIKHLLQKQ